jgi:hypothetical protein
MSRVSGVPVHSSKFFIPLNHSFWVKHILTHPPTFEEVPQLQQPTAKPGTSKLARNASVIFEFLQAVWSIIPLLTDMTRTSGCSWDETMVVILRSWDITPRPYITMVIHNITFDVIIYISTYSWNCTLKVSIEAPPPLALQWLPALIAAHTEGKGVFFQPRRRTPRLH